MRKIVLIIFMICSISVLAGNEQIGRYMTVANKPSNAQVNLMQQTLQVHFPTNVQTVGDAINYLLANSGYELVNKDKRNGPNGINQRKFFGNIGIYLISINFASS